MEILVESQLSMSQQCGLAVMKANCVLGCISKSTASRPRDVIIPPDLAFVRPHLEECVQFWSLQLKKDIEKLEWDQQRATKTRLENKERLSELCLFSLKKGSSKGIQSESSKT